MRQNQVCSCWPMRLFQSLQKHFPGNTAFVIIAIVRGCFLPFFFLVMLLLTQKFFLSLRLHLMQECNNVRQVVFTLGDIH